VDDERPYGHLIFLASFIDSTTTIVTVSILQLATSLLFDRGRRAACASPILQGGDGFQAAA
jgi:hypothetical protein